MDFNFLNTTITARLDVNTYWSNKENELERRMKDILDNRRNLGSYELVKRLVGALLNRTFVIFYFNEFEKDYFVQFANDKNVFFVDVPIYKTSLRKGKEQKVVELLEKSGFEKTDEFIYFSRDDEKYYCIQESGAGNKDIYGFIGKDFECAAKLTLDLCKMLYKMDKPHVYNVEYAVLQSDN
jgi:hypothetical protein